MPSAPPPLAAVASAPVLSNAPAAQKLHSTSSPALNDVPPTRPAPRLPVAEQPAQTSPSVRSPAAAAPVRETSNPTPRRASPPRQRVVAAVPAPTTAQASPVAPAPRAQASAPLSPPPPETLLTALTRTLDEAMVRLRSVCEVRILSRRVCLCVEPALCVCAQSDDLEQKMERSDPSRQPLRRLMGDLESTAYVHTRFVAAMLL